MKSVLFSALSVLIFILSVSHNTLSQDYKVLQSDDEHILLEFNFNGVFDISDFTIQGIKFTKITDLNYPLQNPGDPFLPTRFYDIGIPQNSNAILSIIDIEREVIKDKFVISTPDSADQPYETLNYNQNVYGSNSLFPLEQAQINSQAIFRYIKTASLSIAPFQFNPVERILVFNKRIKVRIDYKQDENFRDLLTPISDVMTEELIYSNVINAAEAITFQGKIQSVSDSPQENYWYNPNKNYFKVYLNKKGVYRLTYDQLINAGIASSSGIQNGNLEIFNDGISLPIDIVDTQQDGLFNSGDYVQFIGKPATPHNQFTRMNIYNTTNVYWFSYQADSVYQYKTKNAYGPGNLTPLITNTIEVLTWEEDKEYHKLGYAANDQRDYWYWGSAEARNRSPFRDFIYMITDSIAYYRVPTKHDVKIKVGMHGLTNTSCSGGNGHDATIRFNSKVLGTIQWNGQQTAVFEKNFFVAPYTLGGGDTAQIFSTGQKFEIFMYGNICPGVSNDYILVNYIEFEYWRWNRTYANNYFFKSPPNNFQENRYYLFGWQRNNMKIYVPSRGEVLTNPSIPNDVDKSVYFNDTISIQTEYFCVADDYFLQPDSIVRNVASDLRNLNTGADYIIVTHRDFLPAAQRLADYRSSNLQGFATPRIKVIDVDQIYNEFSYGLMNPMALNSFARYAYESWQAPAPQYIALMGDMSYDYRKIFPTSRPNFIPSPSYHATIYGQAPSDNAIVTVSGNDIIPDIALGRISCETMQEADILVDKIINYPADVNKEWKQNVLLVSSGLSAADENQFKFNDRNILLENSYLKPNGIKATKIFRYPNKPEYIPFQGEGPDIRREINNGSVIVNYYGHGGGLQWDLVFTNDDIYELNNGNKLPLVISVTCYTAHFDNQEIFGEIFNSIPGKGSIAFWGSSGVTFWPTTANINQDLFSAVFNNKNYVIGKAINIAKSNQNYGTMTALLTLLGDPAIELAIPKKPDFVIRSSNISISPTNPLVNDTVSVKLAINNLGLSFPGDTVTLKLYERIISDTTLIDSIALLNFGESDTTYFTWVPQESGLITLIATINNDESVPEDDLSDNIASNSFSIFDFGEPSIIKPADGYFTNSGNIEFLISDIGFYFDRSFNYLIQINNLPQFDGVQLLAESPVLNATDAVVRWNPSTLAPGEYFWRAIVYDDADTNSSDIRIFSVSDKNGSGYYSQKQQLKLFDKSNVNYSDEFNSLLLNTELHPPYPSPKFLLDSIYYSLPADQTKPSTFTTDGTYFYFGTLPNFNSGTKSKIYKIGTGLNGTVAGTNYGAIPSLEIYIYSHLMSHDGFLYSSTGALDRLTRIDPSTGDTIQVLIPDSLLLTVASSTQIGGVFLYSDGEYVYNLGVGTLNHPNKLVLRVFDPNNNWNKIGEDIVFSGTTLRRISSFIISNGYLIVYENYFLISLRRYRLSDGAFEEDWWYSPKVKDFYAIAYDHANNFVYFQTFRPIGQYVPAFFKYRGTYIEANGQLVSPEIGPASKWHNLEFDIDQTNSNGTYKSYLLGKNKSNGSWIMLDSLFKDSIAIDSIDTKRYNYIKLRFALADSSFGSGQPMKFNSLKVNYDYLPEISIIPKNLSFTPDSVLQGISLDMALQVNNLGYVTADSLKLEFSNNLTDTVFYTTYISVSNDTFSTSVKTIITDNLLYTAPVSPIDIKVVATLPSEEYYTFNNQIDGTFYVVRDSANPLFNITFDGREIINGDIISSEPEIIITLEDNSPLPLDSTYFTIVHTHNNIPKVLTVPGPDITFESTPYPNNRVVITWTPKLEDGRHVLEVLAKDASGNFFDSTSSRSVFNVYNNPDLLQVYNYPNPFSDNTYFTFELRGVIPPEEFKIKIFTVAGRLIKELMPSSPLQIGFNKIYWDGKDEDGDEIANGLYFYKIISKNGEEVKTVTQKLAKVK
jgi:hypothetical protein